jgi:23S rRNA pseudouridine1911/1915/1917 synthase
VPFLTCELVIDETSPFRNGRADRCVQHLAGGSRSHVTGLFDHDCVQLNGELEIDAGRMLKPGDQIRVRYEANRRYSPRRRPQEQKHRGFQIVFEDRYVIVVEKSADLLTVPTDGREPHTLIYRVNEHVRHEGRGRGAFVVHRLDRGVSGLLVFGKTKEVAKLLQTQFSKRKPNRQYDAIVAGTVVQDRGTIQSYLATGKNLNRYSTDEDDEDSELAITHFEVIERWPDSPQCPAVTQIQLQLETGRRNQIRVHLAEAGHTVLGDNRYRPKLWEKVPWPYKRFALHASLLGFAHPESGEPMNFTSPLPREIIEFLRYAVSNRRQSHR